MSLSHALKKPLGNGDKDKNTFYSSCPTRPTCPTCPICFKPLKSIIRQLKCNHTFCFSCIQTWFQMSDTCPLCREKILDSQVVWPTQCIVCGGANPCPKVHKGVCYVVRYSIIQVKDYEIGGKQC